MIDRGPAPAYFESDFVLMAQEKLEEFYFSSNRSQKRYDFPFNKRFDEEVKDLTRTVFFDNCGYCGRYVGDAGLVDRFRPFSGVRDKNDFLQDLYWWLTFNWHNLAYCCRECFQYKANYFPVAGRRAFDHLDSLAGEENLLFYPCRDSAVDHFNYDHDGNILPLTLMGEQTIGLLRLNRPDLVDERRSARSDVLDLVRHLKGPKQNEAATELDRIAQGDPSVSLVDYKEWVLLEVSDENPAVRRLINKRTSEVATRRIKQKYGPGKGVETNDYFPIEQVRIRNFKGITDLTIDLKPDAPQQRSWLFLLGENGAGKSSVLQAIALGLRADSQLLTPGLIDGLIQKGEDEAEIIIKERDSNNIIRTLLRRPDGTVRQEGQFDSFLFGYGSLRLSVDYAEGKAGDNMQQVSYDNLFHPVRPLNDITEWLKRVHREDPTLFDRVAIAIKHLLPHDFYDNELTVIDGEIAFKRSEKSFASLSDGFKSTIILAVDIMMKLSGANTDMDKLSGVVLIDELGNQLHPRWQMRIVEQLRKVFTNLTFIVSTHHPLCLRGSLEQEVLVLKQADGVLLSLTDLPDPSALRVDQLLASEFFGLNSLIDPELEAAFNRYYALLARKEELTEKERDELTELKDQLREKNSWVPPRGRGSCMPCSTNCLQARWVLLAGRS
jgi:ABC-type cobalamin/Fe3+-siderophores transport system ATPase subunit